MLEEAGFADAEWVRNTGMDSSPETRGALFRALRPVRLHVQSEGYPMEGSLEAYRRFFDRVYEEGHLSRKVKHLIALGASLAAGCEP